MAPAFFLAICTVPTVSIAATMPFKDFHRDNLFRKSLQKLKAATSFIKKYGLKNSNLFWALKTWALKERSETTPNNKRNNGTNPEFCTESALFPFPLTTANNSGRRELSRGAKLRVCRQFYKQLFFLLLLSRSLEDNPAWKATTGRGRLYLVRPGPAVWDDY